MKFLAALFVAPLLLLQAAHAQTGPYDFNPTGLRLDSGTKTATAVSGAATLSKAAGVITTEALVTAAAASYTLTLTDTRIALTDQVFASVALGTATTGVPVIATVKPGAGSVVIVVQNVGSAALNGTLKIAFVVFKN